MVFISWFLFFDILNDFTKQVVVSRRDMAFVSGLGGFGKIWVLKMANVEQTQKMVPLITCEISLCQYVCELVFGVHMSFGLWGPDQFCQTTNQEKLCGFWIHVHCGTSAFDIFF